MIASPLDKTGGQIHRGTISPLSGEKGQNMELKKLRSHCRESQALPEQAEIDNITKGKAHF
jgi:hypothetical protein